MNLGTPNSCCIQDRKDVPETMNDRFTPEGLCLEEFAANEEYAEVLFKRAVGDLPEMETSKAMARLIGEWIQPGNSILDVGCGAGHFLRSFKRQISVPFTYIGVELYPVFLEKAEKAWANESIASFRQGNIYDLPVSDREIDIAVCSNVLTHLPSLVKPISELIRVSRRVVAIRSTIGERSYRIQQVFNASWWPYTAISAGDEFDDQGFPRSFSYENIHSKEYLSNTIYRFAQKAQITYIDDDQFDPERIQADAKLERRSIATQIIDGKQVYGNILLPHMFAIIDLEGGEE